MDTFKFTFNEKVYAYNYSDEYGLIKASDLIESTDVMYTELKEHYTKSRHKLLLDTIQEALDILFRGNHTFDEIYADCGYNVNKLSKFISTFTEEIQKFKGDDNEYFD